MAASYASLTGSSTQSTVCSKAQRCAPPPQQLATRTPRGVHWRWLVPMPPSTCFHPTTPPDFSMTPSVLSMTRQCAGKQARRTRNSSPLGELFDHACDNMSCAMASVQLLWVLGVTRLDTHWFHTRPMGRLRMRLRASGVGLFYFFTHTPQFVIEASLLMVSCVPFTPPPTPTTV